VLLQTIPTMLRWGCKSNHIHWNQVHYSASTCSCLDGYYNNAAACIWLSSLSFFSCLTSRLMETVACFEVVTCQRRTFGRRNVILV